MLVGRNATKVHGLEQRVNAFKAGTEVSVHIADATDDAAIKNVADAIGMWDALLLLVAHMNKPGPAISADMDDYWKAIEVCSARKCREEPY